MYKLSQSTIEKLKTYVYLLVDPRTEKPFYVGKGKGNRINHHLLRALEWDLNEKAKIKTIRDIQGAGREVGLVILRHGLSEEVALEIETAMIDFIGKDNLTNLAQGHHATDRGMMKLNEIKIKYEADTAIFNEPVILINIKKRYDPKMSQQDIYEATRKQWKVSKHKVRDIKIACSVYRDIIREVFVIDRWCPATERLPSFENTTEKGRLFFEGKIAPPEIRNKYIDKSVAEHWKQGSQNPIKYVGGKVGVAHSTTTEGKQKIEYKSKDKEKFKEEQPRGSSHTKSISGKYESLRALMEELLLANYDKNSLKPTITYDEIEKIVFSEYPTSKFNKKHLSWYVNKILKNGEFINA